MPLQSGVQTALLTIGLGMVGMFVGYAVGALAVVTVGAVVAWRHLPPLRLPDRSHVRDLVSYAKFA